MKATTKLLILKPKGASTPTAITATSGSGQSANCGAAYTNPLVATITPAIAGVAVTFTAPATGPSGTFASTSTRAETVVTNGSGVATSSAFTANGTGGAAYNVTATSGALSCNFSLTNNWTLETYIASLATQPLFWYEADKITGATNNNPLSTWQEHSGSGIGDATATTTARPTYLTNLLNGLPIVRFAGNPNIMTTASADVALVTGANAATIYVIVKPTSANNTLFYWLSGTNQLAGLAFVTTIYWDHGVTGTTGRSSVANPVGWFGAWHILKLTIGGGTGAITADGNVLVSGAQSSNMSGASVLTIGGGGTFYLLGDLYMVLGFGTLLTPTEQTTLTNLLAAKTGLTVTTP